MTTTDLFLRTRRLASVFELLGNKENDITYSLGWTLSRSQVFLQRLISTIFPGASAKNVLKVSLQESRAGGGVTDIELYGTGFHAIIEAKRGWNFPTKEQLGRYASRLNADSVKRCTLVVMTESTNE
jgi:hypothetical protein